ncbi:MAG TPA: GNAT family N-acetyltransferase [Thermoclostridium caenicola]|nr:GNAT family N-acetyltransferase [Thermoclostridium caenicola]
MFFETQNFYVDLVNNNDLNEVIEIYNSNEHFLVAHMDKERITKQWITEEIGEESYLSLLMIHNDFRGKGFGKLIFQGFEEYVKSLKSKCIRIDVVTNYDHSVLDFWIKNGIIKFKDIELNWAGKRLPAVTMKKNL